MEKEQKDLIGDIVKAFKKYAGNQALVINDRAYTYEQLSAKVHQIVVLMADREEKVIGIVAEDRLETYASILAVLISGKTYVILHPAYPAQRNLKIAETAGLHLVLYADNQALLNLGSGNKEDNIQKSPNLGDKDSGNILQDSKNPESHDLESNDLRNIKQESKGLGNKSQKDESTGSRNPGNEDLEFIQTSALQPAVASQSSPFNRTHEFPTKTDEKENAYIIFTSGSTGEPKGVPISRKNLNAFYRAYGQLGWDLNEQDRMLQMFELTFDVSVVSLLYPLTLGACIYTVSPEGVKYINVIDILEKYRLTFAAVAPSLLQLLLPYFPEIQLPELKHLVVTAEASDIELLSAFRKCAPNARFMNLYGPTEGTIYCTAYPIPATACKHHHGMAAIGKPFDGIDTLIMDEEGKPLPAGETGELWINGDQIMAGYWNAPDKSKECLVQVPDGKIYYRTGDLCRKDADGDIIYCGRKDSQIKLQGFRIELSEIEHVAKSFFQGKCRVVVLPKYGANHQCELHLVIEHSDADTARLKEYMHSKLPFYMIPKQIHQLPSFPLNNSSKTDRKKIQELI